MIVYLETETGKVVPPIHPYVFHFEVHKSHAVPSLSTKVCASLLNNGFIGLLTFTFTFFSLPSLNISNPPAGLAGYLWINTVSVVEEGAGPSWDFPCGKPLREGF